jgi:hypothetical protein
MFMQQHAMLHSARMVEDIPWSFDDEILDDLRDEQFRAIPPNGGHSIAWCIWHITRIEDVTMNILVAGSRQLLEQDNWYKRLKVKACDTGNAMSTNEIAKMSATIDFDSLRAYRLAVGRRTRQIVTPLTVEEIKTKVDPVRLEKLLVTGAVVPDAQDLIDYWGKRTVAGLMLMPASRHILVHLNECLKIKNKLRKL